jgi:thiosulfate/3-mercaptopyruvate sulfurtransferase
MYLLLATLAATLGAGPRLVTASWLAQRIGDPDLVVLHVGEPDSYASHITGAQRTDLSQLAVNAGMDMDMTTLAVEMLPPDVLRARLESYGISDRSTIVVYAADEDALTSATRVVYTLRVAGLGAHAALLDGGLPAWAAEKRPLTSVVPHPLRGHIAAAPQPSLVVDAAWVKAHLRRPGVVVIDTRDRSFYSGTEQSEARRGHIPSARSLPYTDMFDTKDRFKTPATLQALFRAAGAEPGDTVVAYCHIGMQATVVLFAADQVGYPVKLYDGSFEDWARRKDLPVVDPSTRSR